MSKRDEESDVIIDRLVGFDSSKLEKAERSRTGEKIAGYPRVRIADVNQLCPHGLTVTTRARVAANDIPCTSLLESKPTIACIISASSLLARGTFGRSGWFPLS